MRLHLRPSDKPRAQMPGLSPRFTCTLGSGRTAAFSQMTTSIICPSTDGLRRMRDGLPRKQRSVRGWLSTRGKSSALPTSQSRDSDVPPDTGEIGAIYLRREATGQGIGRALFAHAVQDLRRRGYRRATLWVLDTNTRARRFYEAAGWVPDGATKIEERPGALLREVRYHVSLE